MSKTVSVYFDDSEEKTYDDAMKQRVNPQWGKKISPYIVDLVKRDLASDGATVEAKDDVVLQLAKLFHPTLTGELTAALATPNAPRQARIVARFLEALLEALKRGDDFNAQDEFHLYNGIDQLTVQLTETGQGMKFMKALREAMEFGQLEQAAEDAAFQMKKPAPKSKGAKKGHTGPTAHLPKLGQQPKSGSATGT